jgi:hypothetical protein
LIDYLKDSKKISNISALSLSDFCSYCPEKIYNEIRELIVKKCAKKTKFCERQYLVKRNPDKLLSKIKRNKRLEKEIEIKDKTFIYTFCI